MVTLIMIEIYNQKCDTQRIVLLLHSIINYTIIAQTVPQKPSLRKLEEKKERQATIISFEGQRQATQAKSFCKELNTVNENQIICSKVLYVCLRLVK